MKENVRIGTSKFTVGQRVRITKKVIPAETDACDFHGHDFYEFELIVSGKGVSRMNGKVYEIKPGMGVFAGPGDVHDYVVTEPIGVYCIQFRLEDSDDEVLGRFMAIGNCISYLKDHDHARIRQLCEMMHEGMHEEDRYREGLLRCILILFSKEFQTRNTVQTQNQAVKKAITYIHSHFKENPALADVASMLYMSKEYFCTLFHKQVGKSYKSYLREIKLRYAARLLADTKLSVTAIAEESGYNTQSHFNREFGEYYKMSPLAYRKCRNAERQGEA